MIVSTYLINLIHINNARKVPPTQYGYFPLAFAFEFALFMWIKLMRYAQTIVFSIYNYFGATLYFNDIFNIIFTFSSGGLNSENNIKTFCHKNRTRNLDYKNNSLLNRSLITCPRTVVMKDFWDAYYSYRMLPILVMYIFKISFENFLSCVDNIQTHFPIFCGSYMYMYD